MDEKIFKEITGLKLTCQKYKTQNKLLRKFIFQILHNKIEMLRFQQRFYEDKIKDDRTRASEREKFHIIKEHDKEIIKELKELYNIAESIFEEN